MDDPVFLDRPTRPALIHPADGAGHLAASPVSAEPQPTAEVAGPQPTAEIADPQPTQPTSEIADPQPIQPMPADLSAVPNVQPDRSAFLEEMFLQDMIDSMPDAQPDRSAFLEDMLDAEDLFLNIFVFTFIFIFMSSWT